MSPSTLLRACALVLLTPIAASAEPLRILDPYAIVAGSFAKSGAIYFAIENPGPEPDRLIAVETDAAERAEIHAHLMDAAGVMRMVRVEDGIAVAPGETRALARGGDHVMLMGLTRSLAEGDKVILRLHFEAAGEIAIEVTVGSGRAAGAPAPGG